MPTPAAAVAHLLRRTGFGHTPAQVAALTPLDIKQIVDRVLDTSKAPTLAMPAILGNTDAGYYERYVAMVHAWMERMRTAPVPIVEKMTLFWHGHFCSSLDKVDSHKAMWEQNTTFRTKGLGSFVELTKAVALGPAMLRYLDNHENVKGAPNENFARELMELFTLGVNQYTQDDVVASARAWTGHTFDWKTGRYIFRADRHDAGMKTFFGTTQAWDGPQIVDELLTGSKKETAARFLATKLWTFFAYQSPEPAVIDAVVKPYLASPGLQVKELLRAIFLRPEFYSTKAKQGLVRSPVEYLVASMKHTGMGCSVAHPEWWMESMGQQLFFPPNVSGWRPNGYWISSSAQWAKASYAGYIRWKASEAKLLAGTAAMPPADAAKWSLQQFGVDNPSATTMTALRRYIEGERATSRWAEQPNLIMLCHLSPEFQLA